MEVQLHAFLTLAVDAGEWLASWTTASSEALARVKSLHFWPLFP